MALAAATGLGGLAWAAGSGPSGPKPATVASPYERDVKPLLVKYCYECHGDGGERGDMVLDKHPTEVALKRDLKLWESVSEAVGNGVMPPPKHPRPTDAERARIGAFIDREIFGVDCAKPDPGRVTLRRLNRQEYTNTIKDLLGVEFDAGEEFPPDDSGYGFDNIGDVLSLSPVLLGKYLNAADQVARRAVVVGKPPLPRLLLKKEAWKSVDGPSAAKDRDGDSKKTTREARFRLERSGAYRLDISLSASTFDPWRGRVGFEVMLDGRRLSRKTYRFSGNRPFKQTWTLELGPGEHVARVTADTTAASPAAKSEARQVPTAVDELVVTGPKGGPPVFPESHRRIFTAGPAPRDAAGRAAYAREILRRIADRAFRRPADEATIDRLVAMATAVAAAAGPGAFEEGIAQALQAVLVSPRFLFRSEAQPRPDDPAAVHPLDDWALATRLSYWLWSGPPDHKLRELATAGKLRERLSEQALRMLADGKGRRFVADFVGQWLQTRDIEGISINTRRYPALTGGVRRAMRNETELLFAHVIREDRDVMELLTADYSFLNGDLAKLYGVEGVRGSEMRLVKLAPESRRGGILTHGSFLTVTSNPTRTSPVKRGLFVLENVLGTPPPPPPPNVPNLEDAQKGGKTPATVREQLEVHRQDAGCASCHALMDPIGLGLESFNLIGQWRDAEGDRPIDTRGELVTGEKFNGVSELRAILGSRTRPFYKNLTRKLMTYALGRGLERFDMCAVDPIVERVVSKGGRFSSFVTGIVESPAFRMRRGDGPRIAHNETATHNNEGR